MDTEYVRYVMTLEKFGYERERDSVPLFEFEHVDEDSKTGLLHAYLSSY